MYIYAKRSLCSRTCSFAFRRTRLTFMMHCPRVMLVAFWFILLVMAQANMISLEKRGGRRYCGENLNNMLMFLCDGVYKRSDSSGIGSMNWMPSEPMVNPFIYEEQSYFPFKSRDNAVAFIPRQYKRRGVADECCSKPCTLTELSSYCGVRSR